MRGLSLIGRGGNLPLARVDLLAGIYLSAALRHLVNPLVLEVP